MSAALLSVTGLERAFGGVVVADGVNLELQEGELRCLIGPNGAGKSSLVNMITGLVTPAAGEIRFAGRDITRAGPARRRHDGIARTFQTARVLGESTAFTNVLLAVRARRAGRRLARTWRVSDAERRQVEAALALAGLHAEAHRPAGDLTQCHKRLLEIAMAVAEPPRLLLLDEPTAGMSVRETEEVAAIIDRLRTTVAMLVIDHDMTFIRRLQAPVTVLHRGAVVREGTIDELEDDELVREIYLGVPDD
ncbi:MAG TPA: ATP-binding cassette domain-containing protein [Solirubrobacteraceae bacterium]